MTEVVNNPADAAVQPDPAVASSQPATQSATAAIEAATSAASAPAEQKAAPAAPAEYGEFKLPAGTTKETPLIAELIAEAKNLGLSQEAAQRLIDREQKRTEQIVTAAKDASIKWAAESAADKEFGGDKFTENLSFVSKALSEFSTPALGEMLKSTGLINHPEVIRAFYKIGKAMSEDRIVVGDGAQKAQPKSIAQRIYPDMNP